MTSTQPPVDAAQLAAAVAALDDALDGVSQTGRAFLEGAHTALTAVAAADQI